MSAAPGTKNSAKWIGIFLSVCLVSIAEHHTLAGEKQEPSDRFILNATWDGIWISPTRGFIYTAEMHLNVDPLNKVRGHIKWTLDKSPREEEQDKIGLTGIEYVSGKYNSRSKILSIEGTRKNDPHTILGLDKYRLILAENRTVLGGITESHGTWRGMFSLERRAK